MEEENENESNLNDSNVPFSVLMQQACELKTKQNEIFRRKFNSLTSWLQHSMFSDENIINKRKEDFKGLNKIYCFYLFVYCCCCFSFFFVLFDCFFKFVLYSFLSSSFSISFPPSLLLSFHPFLILYSFNHSLTHLLHPSFLVYFLNY